MSDAMPSFLIFKFGFAESRLRICTVDTIVIFFNNFFFKVFINDKCKTVQNYFNSI